MREADLLAADVIQLETALSESQHLASVYRTALFAALDLLHGAALRLLDQDVQIRQLLDRP